MNGAFHRIAGCPGAENRPTHEKLNTPLELADATSYGPDSAADQPGHSLKVPTT